MPSPAAVLRLAARNQTREPERERERAFEKARESTDGCPKAPTYLLPLWMRACTRARISSSEMGPFTSAALVEVAGAFAVRLLPGAAGFCFFTVASPANTGGLTIHRRPPGVPA